MPIQISETTWWLLLGILAGLFLFWLIDKLYRRDGDYAAQRERREVASLNQQVSEIRDESAATQKKLTDRTAEVKRLNSVSEDLRDTIRGKDHEVTNLETALAAAREQQAEVDPLRNRLATAKHETSDLKTRVEQLAAQNKQGDETAVELRSKVDQRDKKIADLGNQLDTAKQSYEKTLSAVRVEHEKAISTVRSDLDQLKVASSRKEQELTTQLNRSAKEPSQNATVAGGASALAGATAAAVASTVAKQPSPASPPPSVADTESTPDATDSSSLSARHSERSASAHDDEDDERPGLLDRLRGAFSGRKPDDLD